VIGSFALPGGEVVVNLKSKTELAWFRMDIETRLHDEGYVASTHPRPVAHGEWALCGEDRGEKQEDI
jgi:hypothetical protein